MRVCPFLTSIKPKACINIKCEIYTKAGCSLRVFADLELRKAVRAEEAKKIEDKKRGK